MTAQRGCRVTNEELETVRDAIDIEGFDYTFIHYSDFDEVKDTVFHKLRLAYIDAAQALQNYVDGDASD